MTVRDTLGVIVFVLAILGFTAAVATDCGGNRAYMKKLDDDVRQYEIERQRERDTVVRECAQLGGIPVAVASSQRPFAGEVACAARAR